MARIAVVGVGLIGGSIALGARHAGYEVLGVDRSIDPLTSVVDEALAFDDPALSAALSQVQLVVLAAPVSAIVQQLPQVLDVAATVTDCGSTKRAIAAAVADHPRRARFVPGHPLAGRPRGGLAQAQADLFRDAPWVLCPEGAAPDARAATMALVQALGAQVVETDVDRHDRAVALTSHLPQLIASALAVEVEAAGVGDLAGTGLRSVTRTAGGPAAIWRDIFESNADEISSAARALAARLQDLAEDLSADPPRLESVLALLDQARTKY